MGYNILHDITTWYSKIRYVIDKYNVVSYSITHYNIVQYIIMNKLQQNVVQYSS